MRLMMFVILQKYDFSSKSQHNLYYTRAPYGCLWYCKSTIFQANHNQLFSIIIIRADVCDTAKVRFFKQITTGEMAAALAWQMFVILQKYDFSSKSQRKIKRWECPQRCLWYCKSTIFQANHNTSHLNRRLSVDVCDTAKVRFFKQITTCASVLRAAAGCLWYCKSTIFQANHNDNSGPRDHHNDVCDTAKVRFFKQITTDVTQTSGTTRCLWYCKSTIFQANHNETQYFFFFAPDVCDTAKVRFFKQITTGYTTYLLLY